MRPPQVGIAVAGYQLPVRHRQLRDIFQEEGHRRVVVGERIHLSEEDLIRYQATVIEDGLVTDYHGHRIVGVPGACGCITAQQSLNVLDGFDLASTGVGTVESVHLQAEAFRRAFADRYRWVGDPKQVAVPWQGLLSGGYARVLRESIDPTFSGCWSTFPLLR